MTNLCKPLLIFDLDGTLIDSVPDLADAVNTMLSELNHPTFPPATIRHWVGNGSSKLIERALLGRAEVEPGEIDSGTVQKAEALFFSAYKNASGNKTVAYDGVDVGLRCLQQTGHTLALVTNKPQRFVPAILQHFNWQTLFALTIGGDSLARKKPDPLPLMHVCQTLNFSPAQALMIGDSKNDIVAGQQAGIDTLGVTYGYNYGQAIADFQPMATFDTFPALVDYILHMNAE